MIGSLKAAPNEICSIQTSLTFLSIVLEQVQRHTLARTNDEPLQLTLSECQERVGEISGCIDDLVPTFKQSDPTSKERYRQARASLKAVNRSKRISRLEHRLSDAKSNLMLILLSLLK